jgi:Tannase and feruloyl esterase
MPKILLIHILLIWVVSLPRIASASSCERLVQLKLTNATITRAEIVAGGAFVSPTGDRKRPPDFQVGFDSLPPFCRVQVLALPSGDSHVEFEVWLPSANWNGRYAAAGNGSFGGSINYYRLAEAIFTGFAGSSTDTGHKGKPEDASWALGHREKIIDFSYRAIHETAIDTKAIIRAYYGKDAERSYFVSCSNGGRQGLMEAQLFPTDYDGILVGAPWFPGALSSEPNAGVADGTKTINLDASQASLWNFEKRGGKLILFHGQEDDPEPTIRYYESVLSEMGERDIKNFLRLYVIPGMGHCEGGSIAGDFGQNLGLYTSMHSGAFNALQIWVERGIAPASLVGTKYNVDGDPHSGVVRTRLLCPYPQVSAYSGSGNVDDAANSVCAMQHDLM